MKGDMPPVTTNPNAAHNICSPVKFFHAYPGQSGKHVLAEPEGLP